MGTGLTEESRAVYEELLGGVTSSRLKRGRVLGYGVAVSTRRVVGVAHGRYRLFVHTGIAISTFVLLVFFLPELGFDLPAEGVLVAAGEALVEMLAQSIAKATLKRRVPKSVKDLDNRRDFEIHREEILQIALKAPLSRRSRLKYRRTRIPGYLVLVPKDFHTREIRLDIFGAEEFETIRQLLTTFSKLTPSTQLIENT